MCQSSFCNITLLISSSRCANEITDAWGSEFLSSRQRQRNGLRRYKRTSWDGRCRSLDWWYCNIIKPGLDQTARKGTLHPPCPYCMRPTATTVFLTRLRVQILLRPRYLHARRVEIITERKISQMFFCSCSNFHAPAIAHQRSHS